MHFFSLDYILISKYITFISCKGLLGYYHTDTVGRNDHNKRKHQEMVGGRCPLQLIFKVSIE